MLARPPTSADKARQLSLMLDETKFETVGAVGGEGAGGAAAWGEMRDTPAESRHETGSRSARRPTSSCSFPSILEAMEAPGRALGFIPPLNSLPPYPSRPRIAVGYAIAAATVAVAATAWPLRAATGADGGVAGTSSVSAAEFSPRNTELELFVTATVVPNRHHGHPRPAWTRVAVGEGTVRVAHSSSEGTFRETPHLKSDP